METMQCQRNCIISYCFISEDMSKTRASCFIRGSKHRHEAVALALVFELLLDKWLIDQNWYFLQP